MMLASSTSFPRFAKPVGASATSIAAKATAQMTDELIEWHPLDGVPAPEYIPSRWEGVHVGLRLIEAMRTLSHMTMTGMNSGFGSAWPAYEYEWTDGLAQASADPQQQQQEAHTRNWTKIIPSSEDIGRMEQAIVWPARYIGDVPQLLRVVQLVAGGRARYREMPWIARRLDLPQRLVRRWNREGLDRIAIGLIAHDVQVF